MYAEVAIPKTGLKTFTYIIPEELAPNLIPGRPVLVPLQKYSAVGVVTRILKQSPVEGIKLKKISGLIDPTFNLTENHLKLINWIAEYYICPVGDVMKAAYPPGLLGRTKMRVKAGDSEPSDAKWKYVFDRIQAKPDGYTYRKSGSMIDGVSNSLITKMIQAGALNLSADYKPHKPKSRMNASISGDLDLTSAIMNLSDRRRDLLDYLISHPEGVVVAELVSRGFSRGLVNSMAQAGYLEVTSKSNDIVIQPDKNHRHKITLNSDQEKAADSIKNSLLNNDGITYLLFGVTGSGKTQVYIEAARQALKSGKSVLILLPEISLTPQAIARFRATLDCPIAVWHSRITAGQRVEIFKRAKMGELKVILGVRSAVFIPLNDLGLIVVDEEQDDSYKQSEPPPRYNARDVALVRARIENATTILGSATPSLESYYNAENGKYELLRLPKRYGGSKLPKSLAIDLKAVEIERDLWPLSDEFIERVCIHVADGKQVIVLLNRRGYSGVLMCRACGYISLCPQCRVGLTYHKNDRQLRCHFCGLIEKAPEQCPECEGNDFEYRGIGTQKLEELLIEILGEKGIIRMDSDSTSRKGELEKIISTFEVGEKPVLLGTRMVAKGHHFPKVGMVGVVLADAGLHLPDFRASEKVFQLLVQAAGRAGRTSENDEQGEFVVQSYDPSSGILEHATSQNYEVFYHKELVFRKELGYPPFGKIIRLVFSGKDDSLTRWAAKKAAGILRSDIKTGKVLGPATTAVFRLGSKYHYQLMMKGRFSADLKLKLKECLAGGHFGQNKGVSVKVDVDPREML
ncbi:MAG: primosomal protein N' [candidate division Zixibacteria bacterium]|nr:primosomal protein N' [candidate division Zixibacteria bacterium]